MKNRRSRKEGWKEGMEGGDGRKGWKEGGIREGRKLLRKEGREKGNIQGRNTGWTERTY